MTQRKNLLSSIAASAPANMSLIIRMIEALIAAGGTVSGVTLFTPDGQVRSIDAETIRQGGTA